MAFKTGLCSQLSSRRNVDNEYKFTHFLSENRLNTSHPFGNIFCYFRVLCNSLSGAAQDNFEGELCYFCPRAAP